ncbi:beta-lactamase family protein [Mumia sp. zg.B53]|uniref:serine hydrolase domain-containing protein n=1 Tax=Mumia sp. zg.B53 TaxID=2855449 RepID=UPI001C6DEE97|nr:serine hydrolase domain-containing protein [Mumia sp. zg.B53]MBW9215049.1 beta-lactamase family protein [Mumia sp. zg.B53]
MIEGTTAPGFGQVRDAFEIVAVREPGLEAQLAVYKDGRQVVDLWTGLSGDSLLALFSSGKGAVHLVVAMLVQDAVLELDRRVGDYWPELGVDITLRELLTHRAGLIGVDGGLTSEELADDRLLAERLAGQAPYWKPGTAYGYHAFVLGALVGEVVRRATGQSIQELYRERVREPYGVDFFLGLPLELESRYLPVLPAIGQQPLPDPHSLTGIAFNTPTDLVELANTRAVRALGPSSAGSVGNARGLARMYAAAISEVDDRPPLLRPETLGEFTKPHSAGVDLVTGEQDHFLLGFEAQAVRYPRLGRDSFGHSGAVGAQAFADPRRGIAYSYTRRRFLAGGGGGAPENVDLVAAVLDA